MKIQSTKPKFFLAAAIVLLAVVGLGYESFLRQNNFEIKNNNFGAAISTPTPIIIAEDETSDKKSAPFVSEKCANPNQRAIAVMMATDAITRPLSGISEADIVFEMPVITDSVTRLMAVYQCAFPKEIGSVRSARHDFIDLANSVDAIYVHWGGSHFALDKLKTGVIDEFDALSDPYGVFYRKNNLPAPHNGFTGGERILSAAEKLKYRTENNFKGFPRMDCEKENNGSIKCKGAADGTLKIGYPGEFLVEYKYYAATNSYLRWRGGKKEIDRNNKKQVTAKNIIAIFAESKQIEGDYNDVALEGQGKAEFYRNGEKIDGVWKMEIGAKLSKLNFYSASGEEIRFAPGNVWIEILQTNQSAFWRNGSISEF